MNIDHVDSSMVLDVFRFLLEFCVVPIIVQNWRQSMALATLLERLSNTRDDVRELQNDVKGLQRDMPPPRTPGWQQRERVPSNNEMGAQR